MRQEIFSQEDLQPGRRCDRGSGRESLRLAETAVKTRGPCVSGWRRTCSGTCERQKLLHWKEQSCRMRLRGGNEALKSARMALKSSGAICSRVCLEQAQGPSGLLSPQSRKSGAFGGPRARP